MLVAVLSAFAVSVILQKIIILFAHRFNLVSKPDQRRRHLAETPSIGGVGVLLGWFAGIWIYSQLNLDTVLDRSTLVLGTGVIILHILGLWDDLINAGPYSKLFVQSIVGVMVITYEPNIHALLTHWQDTVGIFSWIFGFIWIVGITNSINLIDGIDGLAGGMSVLAGISILVLLSWSGDYSKNAALYVGVLLPAILGFLIFNWNPAKIFLGDNGSLPVGLILSSSSLMGYAQTKSWVMVLSLLLIFGYPILDMGICTLKRYQKRQPLFKGDRIHLHFRIMKLGLNVRQTTILLLIIGTYLQLSAIAVNLMSPATAMLGLTLVFFSIFTLLFMVRSIETWKVNKVFSYVQKHHHRLPTDQAQTQWTLSIDLAPIMEKNTNFKKAEQDIRLLESLLRTLIRDSDSIILSDVKILIIFQDTSLDEEAVQTIQKRFQQKIDAFLQLFNIECATSTLPIELKQQVVIMHQNQLEKKIS